MCVLHTKIVPSTFLLSLSLSCLPPLVRVRVPACACACSAMLWFPQRDFGLALAPQELAANAKPLFLTSHHMANVLGCGTPPYEQFRAAVHNAGYRLSRSHVNPLALKTDAPHSLLWDIMRSVVEQSLSDTKCQEHDWPASAILQTPVTTNINFTSVGQRRHSPSPFYLPNPPNWGPKRKHARQQKHGQRRATPTKAGAALW